MASQSAFKLKAVWPVGCRTVELDWTNFHCSHLSDRPYLKLQGDISTQTAFSLQRNIGRKSGP